MTTHRRRFLQGAGGVAVGLPFLTKFAKEAQAAPRPHPNRIITVAFEMGTITPLFRPSAEGRNFTLGELSAPLAPFREQCIFVSGLDHTLLSEQRAHRHGHPGKKEAAFTGTLMRGAFPDGEAPHLSRVMADRADGATDGGPTNGSVCHYVGQRIRAPSHRFASVDVAVAGNSRYDRAAEPSSFFFEGPGNPVQVQANPATVFDRLFRDLGVSDARAIEAQRQRALRKQSVLDAVLDGFRDLRSGLDASDRATLDDHADRIRTIEVSLPMANSCTAPTGIPGTNSPRAFEPFRNMSMNQLASFQVPILAQAMGCGLAPVGRMEFLNGHNPLFGVQAVDSVRQRTNWHSMVHGDPVDGVDTRGPNGFSGPYNPALVAGYRFYYEKLVELMTALGQIPDGPDGVTVLDNTLILMGSDLGDGGGHFHGKQSWVVAGNTGRSPRGIHIASAPYDATGVYSSSRYNVNQLLASVVRMFDLPLDHFGLPGFDAGTLPELDA